MKTLAAYKSLKNPDPDCADFMAMAEQELSAFFNAVSRLFGPEQARLSVEDWVREVIEIAGLPASASEWRSITARASTRLASRVTNSMPNSATTSSLSTQLTNA